MLIRITKPEELSIGQLYLYKEWSEGVLKRGYCVKIEPTEATFQRERIGGWSDTVHFWKSLDFYIACYDAGVYRKYKQMIKRHEQEIKYLLEPRNAHKGKLEKLLEIIRKRTH